MIENKKKYQFEVVEKKNVFIDFAKLYDYISKEDDVTDPYDIIDDFGNNTEYYLSHVFDIEVKSYDYVGLNHYNNEVLDYISNDFYNWVEQNKVFEDIQNGVD